jgi:TrmH family RNA methyltransferase
MPDLEITSTSNPKIKTLIGLRDRRNRERDGVFAVEGPRLVERAVAAGHQPVELFYDPTRFDPGPISGTVPVSCSAEVLSRASYRASDEGVIAVFRKFDLGLDRLDPGFPALLLVVEGVEKPGNLGAVLRTADAVGAHGVIVVDPEIDPFNPNVVRSSTGALFTVPVALADLDTVVAWLQERGITLVGADPGATHDLWSVDLSVPIALLVGSEHQGLTEPACEAADTLVSIPMQGTTDSLNASVTAALLAYEALRQRRA